MKLLLFFVRHALSDQVKIQAMCAVKIILLDIHYIINCVLSPLKYLFFLKNVLNGQHGQETEYQVLLQDSVGEQVAKELAEDDELFAHLLTYINHDQTFVSACTLMEDVLQNRPTLILSRIRKSSMCYLSVRSTFHTVITRTSFCLCSHLENSFFHNKNK